MNTPSPCTAVLKGLVIDKWVREIIKQLEEDCISIANSDPVLTTYLADIEYLLPEITIRATCGKPICAKSCSKCSEVSRVVGGRVSNDILICYRSSKVLFVKIKELRHAPIKNLEVGRSIIEFFKEAPEVAIVDYTDTAVLLNTEVYNYFRVVDKEYLNPVLLVQMVKYLELEKTLRTNTANLLHGLRVSFFYDPVLIESSRLNLFRQNISGSKQ
ncbi:hypothetical protein NEDG_01550 [Nematocida displodere]|uniref:Uncharacterized protein n=1 Tax=Nematocida displodere TaxID=1805483 RepID=A0A177EDG3_9MICR|nr:hypothetical protein NEDG_01550 [Nematocida displodere]